MASDSPARSWWRDDRTVSPLPFFVGTIALVLFTWVWIDVNFIKHYLAPLPGPPPREELLRTRPVTAEILVYVLAGSVTAFLCQPHPWRALGLLPWAGLAFWILMVVGMAVGYSPNFGRPIFAFLAGILWYVPFATALRRLPYVSMMEGVHRLLDWPAAIVLGLLSIWLFADAEYTLNISRLAREIISPDQYHQAWNGIGTRAWILLLIATVALMLIMYIFRREMLESFTELIFLPLYRFKVLGPGVGRFPQYGPVIVVANHAAFFDPLWVGKVIPRQLTPMMTSVYFDKPFLHFLCKDIINAIRVQQVARRKEMPPELMEAVARLDRGECLLIFPEGRMRKSDDELLKRFGQGIWHILKDRPRTPVVPLWIEGGWGSFVSHADGTPPLAKKNKWLDWNRRITIVLGEPLTLPAPVLEQHQNTRQYLMDAVLQCRRVLFRNGLTNHAAPPPAGAARAV
jgi:1-acyl-sn-glycerol-3-phosphate acyltransferase